MLIDGCTIAIACNNDGSETWRIRPPSLPTSIARLLTPLRVDIDGPARVIDFLALAGNLAGAAVEEDEFARRLHLAAVQRSKALVAASPPVAPAPVVEAEFEVVGSLGEISDLL